MNCLFNKYFSLSSLNLSNFNTNKVTNMNDMFNECSSLNSLNLSNCNTKKVSNMEYMFNNLNNKCKNISNDIKLNKLIEYLNKI